MQTVKTDRETIFFGLYSQYVRVTDLKADGKMESRVEALPYPLASWDREISGEKHYAANSQRVPLLL